MCPRRKYIGFFRLLLVPILVMTSTSNVRAENPFQGNGEAPGQINGGVNPPTNFSEDDEFAPDNSFGFTPPATTPPMDNPPDSRPSAAPPFNGNTFQAPPINSAPSNGPSPRYNLSSGPKSALPQNGGGVAKAQTPGQATMKPAPKLEDYLELDSSVKGLEVKNFDLPDKDIKDVVTLISKWTGKNFILDSKVRGKITIIGPSQVTLQEAYQAFLSALDANGLTTVQAGKFVRIIESAEARRAPVKTYAGEYAPKDDQFITRIFQLKYINSDEVQREFRDLTTRQGKLFAYEPTNSIIITDTGSNIQRIRDILETLDVKNFETTLHVLRIRNGSAKSISEMLGAIYGDDTTKGGANRSTQTFRRSALERTRGGGIISKIIPDEQTNSLVVLANQAGFEQLLRLVEKLDVKVTDTGRIHVYYCEYAKAEDLASTLASLAQGGKGGAGKKTGSTPTTPTPGSAPALGASAAGSASGPVTAELEGGARIASDASTNSLVIIANSSDWQTLKRVIKKLDIPRLQVFVESAIVEVALNDSANVGTNIGLGAPGRGFAAGSVLDSGTLTSYLQGGLPPAGLTLPIFAGPSFPVTGVPTGVAGQTTTITVNSFMGLLNLIASNGNTSILQTPQIIALDNEKAEFQVIDEIPVQTTFSALPTGTSTGLGGVATTPTGSIDTKKVGIVIKLTPHVNAASRSLRLEIEQKVDNVKSTGTPSALQNVSVATTSRVTNTQVVVHDQDYIMLGGMISEKVDDNYTKIPLLGDIPILGWLFKSKTSSSTKTNLIILMHPRIIDTSVIAANIIQENFRKRDQFLSRNNGGEDPFKDEVGDLRKDIRAQRERSLDNPIIDYRNNNDDDLDAKPDPKNGYEKNNVRRDEKTQSSLKPDSKKTSENSKQPENLLPPGSDPGSNGNQNQGPANIPNGAPLSSPPDTQGLESPQAPGQGG
jgi:general secretion pathway protein D